MLDLNHPQTQNIIAASRENDSILHLTKKMTLLPTAERSELLSEIRKHIENLHKLTRIHFEDSSYIQQGIDELEAGCKIISEMKSSKNNLAGKGKCDVCKTKITNLKGETDMIYCSHCLNNIDDPRAKLNGLEGFGTELI